jgi:hypothetical protein
MMTTMFSAKTGKNCVEPRNTISKATSQMDRHVATSGFETFEELCEAFWSTRTGEEENEEDENEQKMVPRLTKLCKKLKSFFMRKVEATRTVKTF